jgi:hypothetical protein
MRVPTEKQKEASRQNGKKSLGRPRKLTPDELTNCTRTTVLANESAASYGLQLETLLTELQPSTLLEEALVEDMCSAIWRSRRDAAVATRIVNRSLPASTPDKTDRPNFEYQVDRAGVGQSPKSPGASDYLAARLDEVRLNRLFHRSLNALMAIRRNGLVPLPPPLPGEPAEPEEKIETVDLGCAPC